MQNSILSLCLYAYHEKRTEVRLEGKGKWRGSGLGARGQELQYLLLQLLRVEAKADCPTQKHQCLYIYLKDRIYAIAWNTVGAPKILAL